MKKKATQNKVYEFIPNQDITVPEIIELAEIVRIGVGGHILDTASDGLKKHFREVIVQKKVASK